MGNNRKKNVARIQKDAVWYPKFTPAQARATWEIFGSGHELCYQISKDDFIKAATKGHLRIEKHVQTVERLKNESSPTRNWIDVRVGVDGYENQRGYYCPKGENLWGKRILRLTQHPFYTNNDIQAQPEVFKNVALRSKDVPYRNMKGLDHVSWFEKMLGLVIEN
ncbi:hypothetical protein A3J61_01495 [Candidatus Nomurabacteria bacterium RIFCSPHIGHO2_02_FULL_38_15]|uniref:Uncharacterized protein n=1 Tax=Candidatus Nomurabacteria bacterium RIFCSPHIGHO2_02_FULL_38_15 TaxID=1801752 RepID=A0A1F6VR05_9BACT|nr:MAG: hypothetical protein A3J61_01495 [Candidatus Nomurabacteria bacterium RIFCSPHIGHO2_02_FULL_38_15]